MNRGPAVMPGFGAGTEEWNEHDAHFFVVDDDPVTGFYLSPQAFNDARWLVKDQTLWIAHGPDVVVAVVALS
jgi:hypothetical protein